MKYEKGMERDIENLTQLFCLVVEFFKRTNFTLLKLPSKKFFMYIHMHKINNSLKKRNLLIKKELNKPL